MTNVGTLRLSLCSGPLPKTVMDFWRLIWQERPPTIIMVTNVKEESGKKKFGPFQVMITDQQVLADYTLCVSKSFLCL